MTVEPFLKLFAALASDGRIIEYEIDVLNRRIRRKVDGIITARWLYQDKLKPIVELDSSNTVTS